MSEPRCVLTPLQVTLEKVLGITASGNSTLACDPRSGLVAYPAGWEDSLALESLTKREAMSAWYLNIWPLTHQYSMQMQLPYHSFLTEMFSVQMSLCVCFVLSLFYLKRPEENSSAGFLIRELPSSLLSYSHGVFLWSAQWYSHAWSCICYH